MTSPTRRLALALLAVHGVVLVVMVAAGIAGVVVVDATRADAAGGSGHAEGPDAAARRVAILVGLGIGGLGAVPAALTAGFTLHTWRRLGAAEAELRRREAEGRLWAVLDGSPDSISFKDPAGRYLLCNAAFESYTGTPRDAIRGRRDREIFAGHPSMIDDVESHDRLVLESRAPVHQEREEIDGDGRVRVRSITKFPIFDATGALAGVGTFNQDITELKQAELQLRQALKMQAVGQLTGGVAHDFNNLLAVVLGNLELLRERLDGAPALAGLADQAIAAARRGATTTRRLLAFSRQQPLGSRPVDVAALLGSMSDLLRQSVGETIRVAIDIEPGLRPCFVDPAELEAAVLNLVVNARDAMPEGGSLTIGAGNAEAAHGTGPAAQGAAKADPCVVVSVRDSGSGMSGEVLARAFEPFFTTKSADQGSGLGLSMVYGFAKQSGGHVAIRSAAGAGTTVQLYLPQGTGREGGRESAPAVRERVTEAAPGGSERVLVAEDDAQVRAQVTAQLERFGYRVTAAGDARQALAGLEIGERFDLLLSDVVMPGGMSGFELADAACRMRPGLAVLFISGSLEGPVHRHALAGGGGELLWKPFRREELARRVRRALDSRACNEHRDAAPLEPLCKA